MAKIHSLKISNFRGIQEFDQIFEDTDFICIIGRGDSGKTTILEAISYVLSPSWNLSFLDTDFHNCNIKSPIEIEVSIYDLPKGLIREDKYGLYIRGLDRTTNTVHDEIKDEHDTILTIKLCVERDLEPKWYVVNTRQEAIEIKARDRESLNVFLISDHVDKHFSWNYGSLLYSLLKQEDNGGDVKEKNVLIESLREAKVKIDDNSFGHLDAVIEKVKKNASDLGIDIANTSTTIDFRDFLIKDSKVCLHEEKVPFRLKGKGSKRLISIAIQTEHAKSGGIVLIDELEHGLEPDRAQHLAKTLKEGNLGQIFITTHSRDILVELQAENLFLMRQEAVGLKRLNDALQGCIRNNPEAFFAKRILVCEGATEVGICRALNDHRIQQGKDNATFKGIRFVDGGGANLVKYSRNFKEAGYDVCAFCDSDESSLNSKKSALSEIGIRIIDCSLENSIEMQVFEDLPWDGVRKLILYRVSQKTEASVNSSVETQMGSLPNNWKDLDSVEMRKTLAKVSTIEGNEWFKRIDHGMFLGEVCCQYLDDMREEKLKQELNELSTWIDNA